MRDVSLSKKDQYLESLLGAEGDCKLQSRQFAEELGLARISVSAPEARLISLMIKMKECRKFVEIGTLTGLSAQYIFEALPDGGQLWTLELDPRHGEKAALVFQQLDQSKKKIHLVMGDAREKLTEIESQGPFDGAFIDGNKAAYMDYLLWAEKNLRPGGLILGDNIFLAGSVWGDTTTQRFSEKQVRIMTEFNQRLANPELYESAIAPTAEGLFIAIKR